MATEEIGFVDVVGAIEPKALASAIASGAHKRLGDVVVLTSDWLEERGNPLNQVQKVELTANSSRFFDGFEQEVLDELMREIERLRVRVEGDDG